MEMVEYWNMYWNGGILEWWNTGMVEYWNGGILKWWNTGMVEYWNGESTVYLQKIRHF